MKPTRERKHRIQEICDRWKEIDSHLARAIGHFEEAVWSGGKRKAHSRMMGLSQVHDQIEKGDVMLALSSLSRLAGDFPASTVPLVWQEIAMALLIAVDL